MANSSNSFTPKTINDLLGLSFNIPSYQRGYRWTTKEVRALLDDINNFDKEQQKSYYLQPIVVKFNESQTNYNLIVGFSPLSLTQCYSLQSF